MIVFSSGKEIFGYQKTFSEEVKMASDVLVISSLIQLNYY